MGNGSFERLTNCVVLSPDVVQVWGWFRGEGEQAPEITNCVLAIVAAAIPGGTKLQIKNSVITSASISVGGQKEPGHLEISDSLLWSPDATAWASFSIHAHSPLTVASRNSVFISPGTLIAFSDAAKQFRGWTGSRNVFVKRGEFIAEGDSGRLEEWQKSRNTDSDSIELLPISFDAENWRIWRERSTGYQPRGEEADFGADIDRLLKALIVDAAAAK